MPFPIKVTKEKTAANTQAESTRKGERIPPKDKISVLTTG